MYANIPFSLVMEPYEMNFLKAQTAHVVWKSQVERQLNGNDINNSINNINLDSAGDTNICELGIWLNQNKDVLSKSKHFLEVDKLHVKFHKLIKKRVGDNDSITDARNNEPYKQASHQLKIKLSQLAHDFDYLI